MNTPLIRVGPSGLIVNAGEGDLSRDAEATALIFFDQAPQHPTSFRELLAFLDSKGIPGRRILTLFDREQAEETIRSLANKPIFAFFYFAKSPLTPALIPLVQTLWESHPYTPFFFGFSNLHTQELAWLGQSKGFKYLKLLTVPLTHEAVMEAQVHLQSMGDVAGGALPVLQPPPTREEVEWLKVFQERSQAYREETKSAEGVSPFERFRWELSVPDLILSAGHGLVFLGADRQIKEMNEPMAKILSCSAGSCRDAKISTFFHPPAFSERFFQQLLAERSICEFEVQLKNEKPDIKHLLLDAKVVENHGKPVGFLLLFRNRTTQFKVQETLHEQTEILRHASDAIYVLDLENRITFWNPAAETIYGFSSEQVLGHDIPIGLRMDSEKFFATQKQCLEVGEWSGEMRQVAATKEKLVVSSRWSLVRNRFGHPKALVVINTDITGKRAEQEADFRGQRLESIGAMAGGIAHDLNNILHPISLSLQILQDKETDEESRRILETVTASMERASQMVRQILSFARGSDAEWSKIYVEDFLGDVEHFVRIAFPKNIQFECDGPSVSKPMLGNQTHLYQALLNICINARDAMPEGGNLAIVVSNVKHAELPKESAHSSSPPPEEYVHIRVTDSGCGILPEVQSRILEPYFSTKPKEKGTGLGLATTSEIIRKHGGVLCYESIVGEGTSFHFYLPCLREEAPLQPAVIEKNLEKKLSQSLRFVVPRKDVTTHAPAAVASVVPEVSKKVAPQKIATVLLADDEPAVLTVLKIALEKSGYRVIEARNGGEAVEKFQQFREEIHLMITDIAMPGMSGIELIQKVREMGGTLPIIATTGMNTPAQMESIKAVGANKILTKPCGSRVLLDAIRSLVEPV